jgi:hypothetical protein
MSDVTMAVEQDQVAESLLGDPQPTETTDNATAGTEAEVQPETDTENQIETQEQLAPEQEDAEDWLPTDQDKVFPDDVYAKYATRYQLTPEQAADPLLRQLLHDKINSDIYLRQQQEQQELAELQPELEKEPTQPQAEQKAPTFEEHMQILAKWGEAHTDPRVAQAFADQFMKAFGQEGAQPEVARALTSTFTTFGLNLIQTALPQVLAPMIESVLPGFSGMYYAQSRANAWDQVRNSSEQFSDLPAYGSKEFMELCARLDGEYPALTEMGLALERSSGGQLHGPAAEKFYSTLAKLAAKGNQAPDPQLLQQAVQTGARNARRAEVRRSNGNLGAGQSKGAISQLADDDPLKEGYEIYKRENGRL